MKDPRFPFALDLGTEVGGYRIDKVLGAGGFGITYRAYNDITHKQVAIKEFYIREISSRDGQTVVVDTNVEEGTYEYALKKFQEEAQAVVTRFTHPYIIRGENFLRAHNTCYLIMEYVEGGNLEDWLNAREKPPGEAEIRPLFEKLFDAVDYVHQHNTMHRDLTPRNIMVRANGDPVLIDFGAAGLGLDLGRSSKIVAQMRYAPPEQTDDTGHGIHGRYTDVFSLGGVLLRTVTGKSPTPPMNRVAAMLTGRPDPQLPLVALVSQPGAYSPVFLAGIDRALRLDARERPQTITELRQGLGWMTAAVPLPAQPQASSDETVVAIGPFTLPPGHVTGAPHGDRVVTGFPRATAPTGPHTGTRTGATGLDESATVFLGNEPQQWTGLPREVTGQRPPPPGFTHGMPGAPTKRSRLPALVATVVVIAGLGLTGYVFSPQIGEIIHRLSGPEVVRPFTMTIAVDGKSIVLAGYTPSKESRQAVIGAIAQTAPMSAVIDHLKEAEGAPPDFADLALKLVAQVGGFAKATIALSDMHVAVDGIAATPEAYPALRRALADLVTRPGRGDVKLAPATVAPYSFGLDYQAGGVKLTGYLPGEAAREAVKKALAAALPQARIDDLTLVADGAKLDLAAGIGFLAPRLKDLGEAHITLSDSGLTLSGTPGSPAAYERTVAFDPATAPANVPIKLAIGLPAVSPYQWSLTTDGRSVVARGYAPSAEARKLVADRVAAGMPDVSFKDETVLAAGAPEHLAEALGLIADQVGRLARGRLSITDSTLSVEGLPKTPDDFPLVQTAVKAGLPQGFKLGDFKIQAPKVSPYLLGVEAKDGELRLSGYAPSEAIRSEIEAIAREALPKAAIADDLQIADGAPDAYAAAMRLAVSISSHLATGKASFVDTRLAVDGVAKSLEDFKPLKDLTRSPLPNGFALDHAQIQLRTDAPAQDCDRLALPADAPDKPAGIAGIDPSPNDAPRAVEACRKARAEFPNVRRFSTALGAAFVAQKQYAEAAKAYQLAVDAGDPSAMVRLAGLARDGLGMAADGNLAVDLLTRAADAKDTAAIYALGQVYELGTIRPKDLAKAFDWYTKAAQLNSGDAYARLGLLAQTGATRGIPDYARAADNYENGARLGSAPAMYQLGLLYRDGLTPGHIPDLAKAFDWLQKAADKGQPEAMAAVGQFYLDGVGRTADYGKAAEWLEKAAAAGNGDAMLSLGRMSLEAIGRPRDLAAAAGWFEKAAKAGKVQAYAKLGLVYQTGVGGKPDYQAASDWDAKGTEINDPQAFYQLGQLYEGGFGRPVDFVKAGEAYQRAGELGFGGGFYQIGLLAELGRGRPVDYARAITFYKRASDLSFAPAMVRLGVFAEMGNGQIKDDGAALLWYTKAVQLGSVDAEWRAAVMTDAGRGGPKNPDRAALYVLKAYAGHEPHAVEALNGDMSAFSLDTRIALQRQLTNRGLLSRTPPDGTYDDDTRKAALQFSAKLAN
ncbi:MAG: serine/threonine-protein kinase [Ancalomicrobiaceae bacterium]|nr:serine/threonine-protein kinase [Ancalomicrobiaceae bacterium]